MRRIVLTIGKDHRHLTQLGYLLTLDFRYKGKVSGDKLTLAMWNKGGEEVAKKIELKLVFF
jgi:hypothetical protein